MLDIEVYEVRDGLLGRRVCEARLPDELWKDPPKTSAWTYGNRINGNGQARECELLVVRQAYRIAAHLADRRVLGMDFQLCQEGSVVDLPTGKCQ